MNSVVRVDHDTCIGNGMCRVIAEGVFVLGTNGKSEVGDPGAQPPDLILEAAENCPVSAITVEPPPAD